jgi:hypothetical protein
MSASALPRIAANGLRRSWTSEVISGMAPAASMAIVLGFIRPILVVVASLCIGEALPEEFDQFVFRKEFCLLPSVYFLHNALQVVVLRELSKLNYKRSSHDEFRIRVACPYARGNFVELLWRLACHPSGT